MSQSMYMFLFVAAFPKIRFIAFLNKIIFGES